MEENKFVIVIDDDTEQRGYIGLDPYFGYPIIESILGYAMKFDSCDEAVNSWNRYKDFINARYNIKRADVAYVQLVNIKNLSK